MMLLKELPSHFRYLTLSCSFYTSVVKTLFESCFILLSSCHFLVTSSINSVKHFPLFYSRGGVEGEERGDLIGQPRISNNCTSQ